MSNFKHVKTQLIHTIENTWKRTDKGRKLSNNQDIQIVAAIYETVCYLDIYGRLRGEEHKMYFIKRHLSFHNNLTQLALSKRYSICEDTMGNYSTMYIKVFSAILKLTQKFLVGELEIEYFEELFKRMGKELLYN